MSCRVQGSETSFDELLTMSAISYIMYIQSVCVCVHIYRLSRHSWGIEGVGCGAFSALRKWCFCWLHETTILNGSWLQPSVKQLGWHLQGHGSQSEKGEVPSPGRGWAWAPSGGIKKKKSGGLHLSRGLHKWGKIEAVDRQAKMV